MQRSGSRVLAPLAAAALAAASLTATGVLPPDDPAVAVDNSDRRGYERSFGDRIAGLWFSGDLPGYQQLQVIHADGTTVWSNNFEYGGGTALFSFGAVFGTWERTGRREMRSVEIGFIYDGEGRHQQTGRVSLVYRFSRDFDSATGTYLEELFTPDQDFTDPDVEPVDSFGGPFSMRRVETSTWTDPDSALDASTRQLAPTAAPVGPRGPRTR